MYTDWSHLRKPKFKNDLEMERKRDAISFYIETYEDIKSRFSLDNSEWTETRLMKERELPDEAGHNKQMANIFNLKTRDFIFVGAGGLGKTKQLIKLYDSNYLNTFNKEICFSKHLSSLIHDPKFLTFIKDRNNLLMIDALNESNEKCVSDFFKIKKCRVIATTRPLSYTPWNGSSIVAKMDNNFDYYDFLSKYGKPKHLPMNLMGFIDKLQPREFIILLEAAQKRSKSDRKFQTPLIEIRSLYEKYINEIEKDNKLSKNDIWWFIKKNGGLADHDEASSFSEDGLKSIYSKVCKNPSKFPKVLAIMLENNIVQYDSKGEYILSNKKLNEMIKFTMELNGIKNENIPEVLEKLTIEKYRDDYSDVRVLYIAEAIIRYFKGTDTSTKRILKTFSRLSRTYIHKRRKLKYRIESLKYRLKYIRKRNKKWRKNTKITFENKFDEKNMNFYHGKESKVKDLISRIYMELNRRFVSRFFKNADSPTGFSSVSIYSWLNIIGLVSDFINVKDDGYVYRMCVANGDIGRINITSLIFNFDIPNYFFEFDRKSYSNEEIFDIAIKGKKVLRKNEKLLASFMTYGFSNISRRTLIFLNEKYKIDEEKLVKWFRPGWREYRFWYFLNASSDRSGEFKPPKWFIKKWELNDYQGFWNINNNDSQDKIIEDIKSLRGTKTTAGRNEWYNLCRYAPYRQNVMDNYELEHLLTSKLDDNDLFWFFMERLCSLEDDKSQDILAFDRTTSNLMIPLKEINTSKVSTNYSFDLEKTIPSNWISGELLINDEVMYFSSTSSELSEFVNYNNRFEFDAKEKISSIVINKYKNGTILTSDNPMPFTIFRIGNKKYRFNRVADQWEVRTETIIGHKYIDEWDKFDTLKTHREY